jgi:hypothetical protein
MDTNLSGSHGGCMGLSKAGLDEGTEANTYKTSNTFEFTVDGIVYSLSAIDNVAFSSGHTALGNDQACVFGVWVDSAGTMTTTQGAVIDNADLTAGKKVIALPDVVASKALIGLIKVSTAVATFTPGSTDLNATNVTDTYYDTSVMPTPPFTS